MFESLGGEELLRSEWRWRGEDRRREGGEGPREKLSSGGQRSRRRTRRGSGVSQRQEGRFPGSTLPRGQVRKGLRIDH